MTQEEIGNAGLKLMVRQYVISLWISHSCQIVVDFSEKKFVQNYFNDSFSFYSYSGNEDDTLGSMRYSKYLEMKKKSEVVNPESLPPTETSVYYHSLRVHCQVIALILRFLLLF